MIAKPLREGSELLAMKGVYPQAEIDALPADIEATRVVELKVPGVDSQRHLVFVSHKETNKKTNKETDKEADKEPDE
jgi:16S rRNA G527 N7-methylase RsmG